MLGDVPCNAHIGSLFVVGLKWWAIAYEGGFGGFAGEFEVVDAVAVAFFASVASTIGCACHDVAAILFGAEVDAYVTNVDGASIGGNVGAGPEE